MANTTNVALMVPSGKRRAQVLKALVWTVALVCAAISIYQSATIFHDQSQRDERLRMMLIAIGNRIADIANQRLDLLGVETIACRCSARLPVSEVFELTSFDGSRSAPQLRRHRTDSSSSDALSISDAALHSIVSATTIVRATNSMSHLQLSAVGAPASMLIAMQMQPIATVRSSNTTTVVGFAGDIRAITRVLFDSLNSKLVESATDTARHSVDLFGGLVAPRTTIGANGEPIARAIMVKLDSLSFAVLDSAGHTLYGAIDTTRGLQATLALAGAFKPFTLQLTLHTHQLNAALVGIVQLDRLNRVGIFGLSAILLLTVAIAVMRRDAQLANARSDFIAGVSHELRMPLAQILLSGETLALHRARDDADRDALASSVVREARRLVGLVDNVLLFARSGSTELKAHMQSIAVADVLEDAREAVQLVADDVGQHIDVTAPEGVFALADRQLLRQALVNLLDNAIKYGREQQHIHLHAATVDNDRVRIMVDDQGAGIPKADRERLLEPYERLVRDQLSERTGTGLGLSIVRQVARACNGRVWLDEAPEGGARAVIELGLSRES